MAACAAMPVQICKSFSVNALVAICESRCMRPRISSAWSSGTVMVERMPCMMIEWAPEKTGVHRGVRGQHRGLVLDHLGHHGARHDDVVVVLAVAGLDVARDHLVGLVFEQNGAAVGAHQLEGFVENLRQERLEIELAADRLGQLVPDAQALVVAAQHLLVGDRPLGQELAARRVDALANVALGHARSDGHALQRFFARVLIDEDQAGGAHGDLVAVFENALGDALAVHERSVQ